MSIPRLSNLVLTCSSKSSVRSGIESQLQKIYSVYALSRFLDVSYFHFPLPQHVSFSHAQNMLVGPQRANCYYDIFHIPSDRELPAGGIVYPLPAAQLGMLCNIRDEAKRNKDSFYFIEITSAHQIVEKHPHILHYIKEVSPFEPSDSLPLKIAIHVRQGDLLEPEKALPNSFFLRGAQQIITQLHQLKLPFVCELHIEIADRMLAPALKNVHVGKNAFKPTFASSNEHLTKEFDALPNLKKFINHDPISSLGSLATADFLLLSCYSFSYLAALLNKKGLIIFHPFLKHPLPGWINATDPKMIDQKIEEHAALWKRPVRNKE